MTEQFFLEEADVVVSTARVSVAGKTYATGKLASVGKLWQPADRSASLLFFILAAFNLLVAMLALPLRARILPLLNLFPVHDLSAVLNLIAWWTVTAGIAFLVGGWLIWRTAKGGFKVVLGVDSRQVEALTSNDEEFVTRVVSAIVKAIVARG